MKPWLAAIAAVLPLTGQAEPAPQVIRVEALATAPKVDGNLADWGTSGWSTVPIKPALNKEERAKHGLRPEDDRNVTGSLSLQLKVGVAGGRVYVALKYPDAAADATHRMWEWTGDKYVDGKQREDMAALRFHLAGQFDRSMLSVADYRADVWVWSAARTNPSGVADDLTHHMTTEMLEGAAEYEVPGKGTIYIRKLRDAGVGPHKLLLRPKENRGDKLPSFEVVQARGSAADVLAKGSWNGGHWNLEFGRAMNTGNADDVAFKPGQKILGQVAIFNRGASEHKSISEPLLFDFSDLKR